MTEGHETDRKARRRSLAAITVCTLAWSLLAVSHTSAQTPDSPAVSSYSDTEGHWAVEQIEALEALGVLEDTECGDAMFCPGAELDRAILAVWVVRVVDGADPPSVGATRFSDVSGDDPWSGHIERLAGLGITAGYDDGTYRPELSVTRAQMATFLVRAFELPAADPAGFDDVGEDNVHRESIDRLAASGITSGCGDGSGFCPTQPVNRAHAAVFLKRALDWQAEQAVASSAQTPARSSDPSLAGRASPSTRPPARPGRQPQPERGRQPQPERGRQPQINNPTRIRTRVAAGGSSRHVGGSLTQGDVGIGSDATQHRRQPGRRAPRGSLGAGVHHNCTTQTFEGINNEIESATQSHTDENPHTGLGGCRRGTFPTGRRPATEVSPAG